MTDFLDFGHILRIYLAKFFNYRYLFRMSYGLGQI